MLVEIISVLFVLLILYIRKTFSYWKNRNIPSYPSPSIIFGNVHKNLSCKLIEFYKYFKSKGLRHGGFYFCHQPIYIPIDPDLIKQILTKDFEHFNEKGFYDNEKNQPISMHLFQIGGDRWKKLRVKLTPTYTSGKLKKMFHTMADCAMPLVAKVEESTNSNLGIDIKDIASKYTTDVIGSCAFGIECNSFLDSSSDFHLYGKQLFTTRNIKIIKRVFTMSFPNLCKKLGIVQISRDVEEFYTTMTKENITYRQNNNIKRNDFLQLMMELMHKENINERISVQEIINQSFIFYAAGFETSSSVMSFALLELAQNLEIQDKLREEISSTLQKHNGEISYDSIKDMKYLGLVIDETLRKYPPLVILNRGCSKDYKIPGTDVILEAGTKVFIPVLPLQLDEEYYPEPDKFDPERFTEENKKLRHPFTYLPFGDGPRQCIGLRFGLLQTKIGLVALLRKFKFVLPPSVKFPVEFNNAFLSLAPKEPILLSSTKVC